MYFLENSLYIKYSINVPSSYISRPKTQLQDTESDEESDNELELLPEYSKHAVKCALFVSGLHNMALLALLDTDAANDADTINALVSTYFIHINFGVDAPVRSCRCHQAS